MIPPFVTMKVKALGSVTGLSWARGARRGLFAGSLLRALCTCAAPALAQTTPPPTAPLAQCHPSQRRPGMTRSSAPAQAPRNGITSRCPWTTSVLPACRSNVRGRFDMHIVIPSCASSPLATSSSPTRGAWPPNASINVVKGTVFSTSPPASCRSAKKSTARSSAIRSPRSIYGDTIEKLGQRKYRLTRGGHHMRPADATMEVTSDSVVLTLDDYAIARNTVLRVKDIDAIPAAALLPNQE